MLKKQVKSLFDRFGFEIKKKQRIQIPETFFEIDEKFNNLYDRASQKTDMTGTENLLRRQRHFTLNYLLWSAKIEAGDVCELGCWRGLSAYQISDYIRSINKNITFHIFDSFEGLSEYKPCDITTVSPQNIESVRKQFACPLETVKHNLSEFNFIKYYKGWIPDRFSEVKNKTFSFVHIDVDLYQPIKDSFQFFYPRLVKHGIMLFDDYGCLQFPGAKNAVDECLKQFDVKFFIPLPSGQAFLLKDL